MTVIVKGKLSPFSPKDRHMWDPLLLVLIGGENNIIKLETAEELRSSIAKVCMFLREHRELDLVRSAVRSGINLILFT